MHPDVERSFLELKGVGEFGDECSLPHFAGRGSPLIVDHEKTTQGFVDQRRCYV